MEAFSGSFAEERQPLDRKSTFREATRHAQERLVVENSFQELRSNLAAFTANNDLLRKTLRNQDSLWSLQRLESIQRQNVDLTRYILSVYFSLASRITYGHGYRGLTAAKKDLNRAVQDFRSLLLELATQLQGEISGELGCTRDKDKRTICIEEDNDKLLDNQSPSAISFEECIGSFPPPVETASENRRKILLHFSQNNESNLATVEEFLLELNRNNISFFTLRMKWSQLARYTLSTCLFFIIIVTAGLIVFRPL
ncbi:uncharacterized protein Gasu_00470 [Galdieria sulphuraria]|uniref:Uncharacterized protein n=1 Tax=Galdieria sulphuraria TaxID=130081 RepID=M2W9U0_GALSU|nr:uncharacterized protein Gasu_00470 [Galdieria sulphuraria]EME32676.1 hypothetical protein Gasu_00470 [Galdieria sulphuraria]|eukprot:XP_005709196.1 hypothetical protein Gasu_00470 [Galdieria sulphuraria]